MRKRTQAGLECYGHFVVGYKLLLVIFMTEVFRMMFYKCVLFQQVMWLHSMALNRHFFKIYLIIHIWSKTNHLSRCCVSFQLTPTLFLSHRITAISVCILCLMCKSSKFAFHQLPSYYHVCVSVPFLKVLHLLAKLTET